MKFSSGYHRGQDIAAYQMLGNNGQSGRIPVQPVAATENKRFSLFPVVPCKRICHGVGVIIQRWMNGHSGRFVDDDNIFIFVYNREGKIHRRNLFRRLHLADLDCQNISGMKRLVHVAEDTVKKHTFRHVLDTDDVLVGITFPFQI